MSQYKLTAKIFVNTLPEGTIPCDGPLMYDLNRFIAPNGDLYKEQNGRYLKLKIINNNNIEKFAWENAKQIFPDGSIKDMPYIEAFYSTKKNQVQRRALFAYYFIKKLPINEIERSTLIDTNLPISITNVKWISKKDQDCHKLNQSRTLVNPENIYKIAENVNIDEYIEWNDSSYFVKHDGTRVLKKINDNKYKEITIITGSHGYNSVTLHIDGNATCIRINRLIANIHHGLDLESDLVVDHKNGNITDNNPSNLEIVTLKENTIRGSSSSPIIKVDPNTMTIIDNIRSIQEYADNNPEIYFKTLYRVSYTGELYSRYIWLRKELENILYTVSNSIVTMINPNIDACILHIQHKINDLIESNQLNEALLQFDNNKPIVSSELESLINELDPRGTGNEANLNSYNNTIAKDIPCCKILSYHGGTKTSQIILCLKTLLVFKRSADNLKQCDREYENKNMKCPICDCPITEGVRRKFPIDSPDNGIPIYSYNPAAGNRANGNPLLFQQKYITTLEAIGEYTPSKLVAIRKCLYGLHSKASNLWIKQTNGLPKRATAHDLNWSFYPPINNHLSENNPNWILQRRLNSALLQQIRKTVHNE